MTFDYLHQAQPMALRNNEGGRTLTDRRMLIYKAWFEDQFKQRSSQGGPSTYTLAGAGIAVEGMEHLDHRQIEDLPPIRGRIDGALRDLNSRGKRMVRSMLQERRPERVIESMRDLDEELRRLEDLADGGAALAGSGRPAGELVPALAEVDRRIMALASRQIAGFLFQPLIHQILDNPGGGGDFKKVLETSRSLYRNMAASASYHRKLLEKCLERWG
jgi:hypothetical protein